MELVKIADFDDEKQRVAYSEAKAAAKKKGCRLLTPDEYLSQTSISPSHKLWSCVPFWLEGGLLARYFYFYGSDGRYVVAGFQPSDRCGVVCVLDEKPHKHVWKTKKVCGCGAERR